MRKVYPFYDKTSILARNKYASGAHGRLFLLRESVCAEAAMILAERAGAERAVAAAALHLRC